MTHGLQNLWSPIVHKLTPYIPGEQPRNAQNIIKLNTNECPYPPSDKVLSSLKAHIDGDLRLYPDPTAEKLRQTIAKLHHLEASQVFVGNGSDEVLAFVFQALLNHDRPILMPDITYSFYPVYCQLFGIAFQQIPVKDDFTIHLDEYKQTCGGIIFANPNAPTGLLLPVDDISLLAQHHSNCCIVVDEAYIDFGSKSAVSLLQQYPNIVIIRTLSKSYALAGLRIGYALAHPVLIEALIRVKDSFNSYPLDRLAQTAAIEALEDEEWFNTTTKKIIQTRENLSKSLTDLGFTVIPSHANFVFAAHNTYSASDISAFLKKENIIVRHFSSPRIINYLRISIGTDKDNLALLTAIKQYMQP